MASMNDSGWSPIHHAASKNHLILAERLIESLGYEHLEEKTNDKLQNTPLLLAVACGSRPMVQLLVSHGADVSYVNTCRQGVIDISALFHHTDLIKFFLSLHKKDLNVYKKLVALLDYNAEDIVRGACKVMLDLTRQSEEQESMCHLNHLVDEGLVSNLVDLLKKNFAEDVKMQILNLFKCILQNKNVRIKMVEMDGFQVLVSLIFDGYKLLLPGVMGCIYELVADKDFAEDVSKTVMPVLIKLLSSLEQENQEDVLKSTLKVMDLMAAGSLMCKDSIGKEAGLLGILVKLFKVCQVLSLLTVWSGAIGSIAEGNRSNQDIFLNENIGSCLHQMLKSHKRDVQISAVKTLHRLVEENPQAQKKVIESNNFSPLVHLLRRSKSQFTQETIAMTLWTLSGLDTETQRMVAARIGIPLLVEFLSSPSYILNLIGTRGLRVLIQGAYDLRNAVMSANGARQLVGLLRSPREDVVLSAIQALRHICLGVGFIPHVKIQSAVASSRGLKFLIALLRHSQLAHIKVEAALGIAASVLGHSENLELIGKGSGFSYTHVLLLLRSSEEAVRLTAGEALATFAFNSTSQQREIVQNGGLRWSDFSLFLESDDQNRRALAAFQLVVLAHIIPDKDPSYTCAVGIQTLVEILETTRNYDALALAADCVARLSHTRAGLSAALVSIDIVNLLCPLLSIPSQQVKGSASIALSYLSFNPLAERQLLQRCRREPELMKVLIHYNKKRRWSESFLERWRHIRELTLPPIRRTAAFVTSSGRQIMDRRAIESSADHITAPREGNFSNYQNDVKKKNNCLSV
ncbi:ankyrin and armadillo repeat-containing protein-like isoform X1 [Dendrobates tinctorius]|uniref:ankyrin and armadillo repeat-containing protein-like isoform X1 n=1 Tax=Dendrobates tinctorius TaxID=92724 RepID=UPI003CCA666E